MEELKKLLEIILSDELQMMVLSAPRKKESYLRVRIRPVEHRGALAFQAACWDGKKEFHTNNTKEEMIQKVLAWMETDYRQLQAETVSQTASVLVSKKGKVTVKTKHRSIPVAKADMSHNRTKQYLLPEGEPVPFLVKLGVMTMEGKVVKAKYDKFRQINRFLEFIEDICPVLSRNREISMIDFGCGKSYLTFAMYYYLHEKKEFGYEKLKFLHGDIADYEGTDQVDLVVTLHACDTATDYALAKAVAWNAKAILSVPCCQHELNRQIRNEVLEPVLKYGLLKERMAALLTDGLRASMLERAGYQVQVLEFIDMEHTPKNILIRAVKEPEKIRRAGGKQTDSLQACMDFLQVHPTLQTLLEDQKRVTDDFQVKKNSEGKPAELAEGTKNMTQVSEKGAQVAEGIREDKKCAEN